MPPRRRIIPRRPLQPAFEPPLLGRFGRSSAQRPSTIPTGSLSPSMMASGGWLTSRRSPARAAPATATCSCDSRI